MKTTLLQRLFSVSGSARAHSWGMLRPLNPSSAVRPLTLGLASLLLTASVATAGDLPGVPTAEIQTISDAQLGELRVSKVQPVVFADATQDAYISAAISRAQGVASADGLASGARIDPAQLAAATADQGFGFAGASSELDVLSLKFGYLLGALPALKSLDSKAFDAHVGELGELGKLSAVFVPGVGKQIEAFVASAQRGELDHAAYMGMMREAAQGIATAAHDPAAERRHGYLLLGLWSGLAQLSALAGEVPSQVAQTGELLVSMFEKDASFGGSDRLLASLLREVNAELRQVSPSSKVVQQKIAAMLSVSQDA